VVALRNVVLDIPHNTFVTIVGPSGCGKTTLLRMISGLETPTSGNIITMSNSVIAAACPNPPAYHMLQTTTGSVRLSRVVSTTASVSSRKEISAIHSHA